MFILGHSHTSTHIGERLRVVHTPTRFGNIGLPTTDYSAPDDWEIEFAEVPFSEASAMVVIMVRSEGFEPPTPGSEDLTRSPQDLMSGHV